MRIYVMEAIGTFFLTVALIFAPGNPLAAGLMLLAMTYVGNSISGAHLNPAISLSFFIRGAITSNIMFWYFGAQIVGAFLAHCLFKLLTGSVSPINVGPDVAIWVSLLIEVLLTSVLALVSLTVTTTARYRATLIDGVAIGLTLVALVSIGGFINPAVAIGSMLLSLTQGAVMITWQTITIAVIAPLLGGVFAALEFKYLNPNE